MHSDEKKHTQPDPHADTAWTLVEMLPDTPMEDLWLARAEITALNLAMERRETLDVEERFYLSRLVRDIAERLARFEERVQAAMRNVPLAEVA